MIIHDSRPVVLVHTIEQWMSLKDEVKKLILRNIMLKERLENWFKQRAKKPKSKEPSVHTCLACDGKGQFVKYPRMPGIHPSQISTSECDLKLYYDMIGMEEERDIDFRLQLIFDLGHAAHGMFQNYGIAGAWGDRYKAEVPIREDLQEIAHQLYLEGSADAENILVIDDIPNHEFIYEVGIVHEYKTINSSGFSRLSGPKPAHKFQGTIYCAALNRPITVYLYLNKDDSNILEYPVSFDANLWNGIYARSVGLNSFYEKDLPPPGKFNKHVCSSCGYRKICTEYKERTSI